MRIIGTSCVQPPFSPAGSSPAALNCAIKYGTVLSSPGVPGARPWNSSDASVRVMSLIRCMSTLGAAGGAAAVVISIASATGRWIQPCSSTGCCAPAGSTMLKFSPAGLATTFHP